MKNYDPNKAASLKTKHQFYLKFQRWTYVLEETAEFGGNCTGIYSVDSLCDQVLEKWDYPEKIILKDPETGETLEIDDQEITAELLQEMLVEVRIVDVVPIGETDEETI